MLAATLPTGTNFLIKSRPSPLACRTKYAWATMNAITPTAAACLRAMTAAENAVLPLKCFSPIQLSHAMLLGIRWKLACCTSPSCPLSMIFQKEANSGNSCKRFVGTSSLALSLLFAKV